MTSFSLSLCPASSVAALTDHLLREPGIERQGRGGVTRCQSETEADGLAGLGVQAFRVMEGF